MSRGHAAGRTALAAIGASLVLGAILTSADAVYADDSYDPAQLSISVEITRRPPQDGTLPATGPDGDAAALVSIAVAALGLGAGAVVISRRRRRPPSSEEGITPREQ